MRIGVLIGGGERAVRAAHSLAAEPTVDEVVVVGPAKSSNFRVVDSTDGLDLLVGSGPQAPTQARKHGIGLVWDGDHPSEGVVVWGASVLGVALAVASQQRKPTLVAVAHPDRSQGTGSAVRFPIPVGATQTDLIVVDGLSIAAGKSYNEYAACQVETRKRSITVLDRADFLSGLALAAGVAVAGASEGSVWREPGGYLQMASGMGLVMNDTTNPG